MNIQEFLFISGILLLILARQGSPRKPDVIYAVGAWLFLLSSMLCVAVELYIGHSLLGAGL